MATFVLIHGSWHGGWCFDLVKERLEAAGHVVIAPDLPGMGGSEEELGAVTLSGWAGFAADLCRDAPQKPVILVGHSRGGLVVSQAAETAPEAIDAIVYICAMMLPDGMSRAEFKAMEIENTAFDALVSPTDGGHGTVVTGERPQDVFAQLSPPDLVEKAMARLVAEPHGPRSEKLLISAERWGSLPRTYVACTEDRTIPYSSQLRMQEMSPGAKMVTLKADHSPFLSQPGELTEALLRAAKEVGG